MVGGLGADQRVVIPITNSGYGVGETGKFCTEETPMRPVSLLRPRQGRDRESCPQRPPECHQPAPRDGVRHGAADASGSAGERLHLSRVHDRFIVLFEAHFKRNYIHVRDVSNAFLHAITNFETMSGEPYNVGLSDANLSKWELCERIQQQLPKFVFLESQVGKDPDQRDYIVSNEKIERTGFKPCFSLDAGIAELVKGFAMIEELQYANV